MTESPFRMDDLPAFLRFAARLSIAHQIPGRVRLKLAAEAAPELAATAAQVKQFSRSITEIPGIRSVNLNPLARSCVVEYDPRIIPPSTWADLVSGTRSTAVEGLFRAFLPPEKAAACV